MKKRMICMLLAIVMLIGLLPVAVFADSVQGTITENMVWNDGDVISSAVTISGGTQSSPVMITVNGTVTVNAAIEITGHVCITGGGTLQRGTGGFAMLKVNDGGSLTTYNVTIDGNTMVGSYNRGIEVASGGSLVINEGTVLRNHTPEGSEGSVLQIYGSVVMNGGIIENNRNDKYGNIYLRDGATFTMNGGIVRNNTLRLTSTNQYGGGAFYVRDATFTMNGGSISGHHINAWGGAIYCTSYAKVYLNGGVITDNSAYQNRGDSVFYSSQHNNDGELHLGGNPYVANSVYLDDTNGTKKPYITSVIKQPITLMLPTYEEGRVVAVGVGNYTLTEADMSKITLMTTGGTRYYAKLDVQNNQLLMTNTDPGYPKVFYVSYHGNGGTGTTEDNTAYASGAQAVIKVNAFARTDYAFTGWNTKADGSGTTYMVGESIPVTNDVVLYAQWTNVPHSHSYTYTAGGNVITEFCTCGHQKKATLTAPTGTIIYDGAEKKSATVTYSSGWLGGELTVSYANNINAGTATASIQKGNAIATMNFIISKADQSAPTGLTKTDETISKKADGRISGFTGNMEYRKEGDNAYTAVNSETLENLSAGKYYVRYAGDGNHNPSADVEIAIAEGRKLLVTYKVDGEIFDTVEVSYGDNADAPQLPGKEGYTGTWDVDGTNIIADTAINAVYTANKYTITFNSDGGSEIAAITQDYGTVVTAPADPTKTGYTFAGWDAQIPATMPAQNLTIKANWTINKYTVTYKADGQVVGTVEVEHGKDATAPEIPAKTGYTAVWDKDGKNVTTDTEINAVYTINKYTVTYKADGQVVGTVEVEHGKDATAPEIPAKEGYTDAWDKDGKNITADTEINAVYTINKYTVTYKADGQVVGTVEVEHGKDATAPEIPAKEGYTAAWDKDGKNITADTEINAVYTINKYTVKFVDEDGYLLQTSQVAYGETPAYTGETPIKNATAQYTYTFAGWDQTVAPVTGDVTYKASYSSTVNKYTVTFKADGKVVGTVEVEYGKDATAPAIPAKEGYDETAPKWDADGKNITADTVINAVYTKNQPGEYADVTPDTNVGGGKVNEEIEELKEKVPFTDEEEKQIEHGADVEVWLEIKDISNSVSAEDKAKVTEKLGDADVALYLDIAMFKQVGENEASRLTQLGGKVRITFKLPDEYINTDKNVIRTYSIIHVHNGKAEVITPAFDAQTNTLTFETDRFSTYAAVYTDEKITPPADTPATGDSFQTVFWTSVMVLSAAAVAVLLVEQKKRRTN